MLQVALLCLLLGSGHSFSVSRNVFDKTEGSSGMKWANSGSMFDDGPKGNKTDEDDDLSVSDLLEKANKNLGKNPSDPEVRELDIAVGSGLQNADPCTVTGCMWPKAKDGKVYVPYRISCQYKSKEKSLIVDSMRSFAARTCVHFIPRTTQKDYLNILSDNGCWSYVGRQSGRQELSLERSSCLYKSTIQHALLHALGFDHEQTRSDRDKHVVVLWQNIKPGKDHNFDKIKSNNLCTPYDYNSVMHYGSKAFSKNGKDTLVPIPNHFTPIGTAKEMNDNDIVRINRLYC